ncbi:M56 family metallopeptidase [Runella slithyformis]|uniref:TonB family protein n=1 Tax=Runella slithyformis (strain ATCC 29530 / DSM 19594 / LMG 11500 / NCIMB 11436 / LSU 4) TaxID=761193 RepID=A0A7U4E497_RUNSL|nr:M56 family metallopeptidase [Runella slithyformis]AEI46829.1 TonB family protein [Runella slithyformis DSM 19594]
MESFMYLFKASAGMVALYALYWLLLRRHTYFTFNRFYLLAALFVALAAPLVVLTEKAPEPLPMTEITLEPSMIVFTPAPEPFMTMEQILWLVYGAGIFFMLGRLVFRLRQIVKIIRAGERQRAGNFILVRAADASIPSFSFLNYLVVSQKDTETYGDVVLRHELVHIRQRHSWDLLWLESVHVFWWFNPILIFFKRSLKEVHEFIADELATNGDRMQYAHTLVGYAFGVSPNVLTNNFFDTAQLKNRIAMLTKNRSSRWVLGRYLLAVPVIIGLVVLVAARRAESEGPSTEQGPVEELTVKGRVTTNDGKGLPGVAVIVANSNRGTTTDMEGNYLINVARGKQLVFSFVGFKTQVLDVTQNEQNVIMQLEPKELNEVVIVGYGIVPAQDEAVSGQGESKLTKKGEVFTVVEQNPEFPGGLSEMGRYLGRNIKYPAAAQRANVQGKVFVQFVVGEDGDIRDPKILKGIGFGCDEEALRVTLNMPKWNPGKQNGKPVAVQYNLPIAFVLEKQTSTSSNGDKSPEFPGGMRALQQYIASNLKYPEPARRAHVEGIVLVSFTVTKEGAIKDLVIDKGFGFGADAEAIRLISTMPHWTPALKDGQPVDAKCSMPVSFVLEKKEPSVKMNTTNPATAGGSLYRYNPSIKVDGNKPLIIVDGIRVEGDLDGRWSPEDIESIDVLKNESATKIYGSMAMHGVVRITTKKAGAVRKDVVGKNIPENVLWLLDGKEMEKEQIQKLNPDSIQSMNVLKGEAATKKHGDKGKNGVIEITTKKN